MANISDLILLINYPNSSITGTSIAVQNQNYNTKNARINYPSSYKVNARRKTPISDFFFFSGFHTFWYLCICR